MKTNRKKILRAYLYNSLAILGVIVILTFLGNFDPFIMGRIITLGSVNVIAAVSLNLVSGCLGEMVLGHGGFMFIGAIAAALITRYFKVSDNLMLNYKLQPAGYLQLIICIIGGAIAAGIVGFIVGMPILRLKGDYLAIVTLGFTLIMVSIGNNIVVGSMGDGKGVYINGSQGINGMNTVVGADVLFCVVLMVLCIAGLFLYMKTRFGRSILAIRDDHTAAEASGVNVKKVRLITFIISSAVAGIAGALYVSLDLITPAMMSTDRSIEVLIVIVLGGLGSFTGSVISAFFLTALPIVLVSFSKYQKLVYAIILLVVMLLKPTGIFGTKEFSWKGLVNILKSIWFNITHPKVMFVNIKNAFKRIGSGIKERFKHSSTNQLKGGKQNVKNSN